MTHCDRCGSESDALWCGVCPACRPTASERRQRRREARQVCPACGARHFAAGPLAWCVSSCATESRERAEKYLTKGARE